MKYTFVHFLKDKRIGGIPSWILFIFLVIVMLSISEIRRLSAGFPSEYVLMKLTVFIASIMVVIYLMYECRKQQLLYKKNGRKFTIKSIIFSTLIILPILTYVFYDNFYLYISFPNGRIKNDAWEEFTSQENSFKVLFPSQPKRTTEQRVIDTIPLKLDMVRYTSRPNIKIQYDVSVSNSNSSYEIADSKAFLNNLLTYNLNLADDNNLVSSSPITYQVFDGLEFLVSNRNLNAILKCRSIVVYKTIYSLCLGTINSMDFSNEDYNKFINSFKPLGIRN